LELPLEFGLGMEAGELKLPPVGPGGAWLLGRFGWLANEPTVCGVFVATWDGLVAIELLGVVFSPGLALEGVPLADPNVGWAGCDHESNPGQDSFARTVAELRVSVADELTGGRTSTRPESRTVLPSEGPLPRVIVAGAAAELLLHPFAQSAAGAVAVLVAGGAGCFAGSERTLCNGCASFEAGAALFDV
jgi:hypothetical protein